MPYNLHADDENASTVYNI